MVEEYFPRRAERILLKSGGRAFIHRSAADAWHISDISLSVPTGLDVEPPQSESYETHKALLGQNIAVLEGLDLSDVANGEYFLIAPPLKIESAEASPVRAMLITDYVFWSGKPEA